ncbi:hypothetical protein FHX81_0237 [Saccharothrix saharensis]|uniref:Uncharacterized protein n=1 Tax=Saccharothrix saharensis TaxID=571190 RepID=A0A543J5C9_9PSEU|nr:hypothetical protein FHX81_0237 [Saccharothrix saharensis]
MFFPRLRGDVTGFQAAAASTGVLDPVSAPQSSTRAPRLWMRVTSTSTEWSSVRWRRLRSTSSPARSMAKSGPVGPAVSRSPTFAGPW